jgi:polyisoprenoid-binding protein YceI
MKSSTLSHRKEVTRARPRRVKRILMWIIVGLVAAFALFNAALFFFSGSIVSPAPAPLQLPPLSPATTSASSASLAGTWVAEEGSVAGFRVPESFLVQSGTIVGRASAVTGSLVIAQHEISSASFQVDLRQLSVRVGGKQNTTIFQILDTSQYPEATLTLTQPIVFASLPTNGQAISSHATLSLAMDGVVHTVTFTVMARSNGSVLEATGSAPVLVSEWRIQSPFAVHNNAVIEFLMVLRRG